MVRARTHTLFVLDFSKSMAKKDVDPRVLDPSSTSGLMMSRLDAALGACRIFLHNLLDNNTEEEEDPDAELDLLVSVSLFNDTLRPVIVREKLNQSLLERVANLPGTTLAPAMGTKFQVAFNHIEKHVKAARDAEGRGEREFVQVVFLTDGRPGDWTWNAENAKSALQDACLKGMLDSHSNRMELLAIGFGPPSEQFEILQKWARFGRTNCHFWRCALQANGQPQAQPLQANGQPQSQQGQGNNQRHQPLPAQQVHRQQHRRLMDQPGLLRPPPSHPMQPQLRPWLPNNPTIFPGGSHGQNGSLPFRPPGLTGAPPRILGQGPPPRPMMPPPGFAIPSGVKPEESFHGQRPQIIMPPAFSRQTLLSQNAGGTGSSFAPVLPPASTSAVPPAAPSRQNGTGRVPGVMESLIAAAARASRPSSSSLPPLEIHQQSHSLNPSFSSSSPPQEVKMDIKQEEGTVNIEMPPPPPMLQPLNRLPTRPQTISVSRDPPPVSSSNSSSQPAAAATNPNRQFVSIYRDAPPSSSSTSSQPAAAAAASNRQRVFIYRNAPPSSSQPVASASAAAGSSHHPLPQPLQQQQQNSSQIPDQQQQQQMHIQREKKETVGGFKRRAEVPQIGRGALSATKNFRSDMSLSVAFLQAASHLTQTRLAMASEQRKRPREKPAADSGARQRLLDHFAGLRRQGRQTASVWRELQSVAGQKDNQGVFKATRMAFISDTGAFQPEAEMKVYVQPTPFSEGGVQVAYLLAEVKKEEYPIGDETGKIEGLLVGKESSLKVAYADRLRFHADNARNMAELQRVCEAIQKKLTENRLKVTVEAPQPVVYRLQDNSAAGKKRYLTVEYFLSGSFVKFNNNYGWRLPAGVARGGGSALGGGVSFLSDASTENIQLWKQLESANGTAANDLAQCLVHFSAIVSEGKWLISDIQGVIRETAEGMEMRLSDPQVVSREALQFGKADGGLETMRKVASGHKCGFFCHVCGLCKPGLRFPHSGNHGTSVRDSAPSSSASASSSSSSSSPSSSSSSPSSSSPSSSSASGGEALASAPLRGPRDSPPDVSMT
uniref:Alpha-type protein kinase domain-containing protein n=1 Tax=Chromera velia CCMP2878 TaxID=1169474 RepID=A0A0G4I8D6_9ALVE|eukprot:Cvel_11837.t1-p1 / transcript=Cvel_11837.t1 / gene=Cvel_11837 / organism=Chromera_velia_CCMP2878 / gene_product=hypothetical protein / transcript_product=hypothetical protein / location=Cvel_scaffold754:62656-68106(-) / protein_length=1057 / sequence_SO=supercontig / SO=protein_coding / is_pseudo=false